MIEPTEQWKTLDKINGNNFTLTEILHKPEKSGLNKRAHLASIILITCMSTIRRQSIISSACYFRFHAGIFIYTIFLQTRRFTECNTASSELFLPFRMWCTRSPIWACWLMSIILPIIAIICPLRNDLITWALLWALRFILVMIGGWVFKDLVIRKFGAHSAELVIIITGYSTGLGDDL